MGLWCETILCELGSGETEWEGSKLLQLAIFHMTKFSKISHRISSSSFLFHSKRISKVTDLIQISLRHSRGRLNIDHLKRRSIIRFRIVNVLLPLLTQLSVWTCLFMVMFRYDRVEQVKDKPTASKWLMGLIFFFLRPQFLPGLSQCSFFFVFCGVWATSIALASAMGV